MAPVPEDVAPAAALKALVGAIAFVSLGLASTAVAAPRRLEDTPCKGCVLALPDVTDAGAETPLLVLLHGDGGHAPSALVSAWERSTRAGGIALLALRCPRDLGCTEGSFWKWDGSPAWLDDQVRAVRASHAIDATRVWLAGWSGGASYLGRRLEDLSNTFAAVVFHGGGIPPHAGACASHPLPTYFLVGDKNPLHGLAVSLRDEAKRCGHDVTWDLVPGADHAREWTSLAPRAPSIVAWLQEHPRPSPASSAPAQAAPAPAPAPEKPNANAPRPRAGCTASPSSPSPLSLIPLALLLRRRRPLAPRQE